ncbi:hypothetical protein CUMW_286850 [Citrus unshiu]|uniref:Uncharacterized protein n=1 Tax=Citrus unshiu TaxID=55188 RepID=A0A2H5N0S4_CITUN|nr:hypothetical protein CUMW_286850 [Citrus unshiu]
MYCIFKGSALREEVPLDIYITGKEYLASDRYQRGHERGQQHLLRYPYSIYGDTITLSKGLAPADPLYLAERDYQTYYLQPSIPTSYYGASSVDPYLPPPRREDMPSGSYSAAGLRVTYRTDPLRRGENDEADG